MFRSTLFPPQPASSAQTRPPPILQDRTQLWTTNGGVLAYDDDSNGNFMNWAAPATPSCTTIGQIYYLPSGSNPYPYRG